ncbi:MAG: hypothetical protein ABI306_07560 [Caulobacteraceae bacterium]
MWEARWERWNRGERVSLLLDGAALSFGAALDALWRDEGFRSFLLGVLADAPFPAFFWEMPPITRADLSRPFEYVAIAAPGFDGGAADPRPFAAQLVAGAPGKTVVAFANLSGDATLIAPRPLGLREPYAHFAAFLRGAPTSQQHDLLALTAAEAQKTLSDRPLWISTAGLGVFWLHVRLDSRPKYYSHAPYQAWPRT